MPFSRSRSIESITRSATSWFARKAPDCHSMASTSVVLPWSTCATMATLRRSSRATGIDSKRLEALPRDPIASGGMSDLEPRRGGGISRRQREQRAYTLVLATGGLALATIVLVILAVLGVTGLGPAVITALLAGGGALLLKRTLSP